MKSTVLALITLACVAFSTSFAHAGPGEGGGGDPQDIRGTKLLPTSKAAVILQASRQASEDQKRAKELAEAQEHVIRTVSNLSSVVTAAYRLMLAVDYPFDFPGTAPSLELIDSTLRGVVDSKKITINNSLIVNGKPAVFFSFPVEKKMQVNFERLQSLAVKECAQTLSCTGDSWSSIVATVFHEALVLNNIEQSRTYLYTSKFKAALDLMLDKESRGIFRETAISKNAAARPAIEEASRSFAKQNELSSIRFTIEAYDSKINLIDKSVDAGKLDYRSGTTQSKIAMIGRGALRDLYMDVLKDDSLL